MSVCLTSEKRDNIKKELKHWHENRKSFTIMQRVILCGTLEHWADTSLYARFLFSSIRTSVNHSIRSYRQITIDSRQIKTLFTISKEDFSLDNIT